MALNGLMHLFHRPFLYSRLNGFRIMDDLEGILKHSFYFVLLSGNEGSSVLVYVCVHEGHF